MKYDLLLTGATVIDPSQNLHGSYDVAVQGDRIAAVAPRLEAEARQRLDLRGRILTPGWIDIHTHLYAGGTTWGIQADALCLATGVTTVVDAGSAGWANFLAFKEHIADRARTRMLAFVHVAGIGLAYGPLGELEDLRYADAERTAFVVHQWPETCVGIKVRQGQHQVGTNGVEPLRLAVQAGELSGTPVMVHIGAGVPLPSVLELLRPGDIITHCYQGIGDSVTDADGCLLPLVRQARQRGVWFDVGHGGGSFSFRVARQALAQDFASDVISTDLHAHSLYSTVDSLPHAASKLLGLGVDLTAVVRQTTCAAARVIGRQDELGTLRPGTVADLAAFEVQEGEFDYVDVHGQHDPGSQRIRPVLTVRAGRVYQPEELAAELEEMRRRAALIRNLSNKDWAALGWQPGSR